MVFSQINKVEVRMFILNIEYDGYFDKTEYYFIFSDILNPAQAHRAHSVQSLENIINSIKSKRKLVNPKSDSKIKFDPSNFISTTIHQQTNYSIMY